MSRVLLCACGVLATTLAGAQPVDPEWPCVQVLVPEISAGILWPLPLDDAHRQGWQSRPEIAALARELGDAEHYSDALASRLENLISALPEAERADALNLLAAATLELANARRSRYIEGIKRYTRQQIAIARQVETALNRLARQDDAQAQGRGSKAAATETVDLDDPQQRAEFEDTLRWHQRVYDQREQAIGRLCERPVELEQTLSSILRDMASYLP